MNSQECCRGAEAAILVSDITIPASFVALQDWSLELKLYASPELMLVICGNKSDLGEFQRVDRGVGETCAAEMGAVYVETLAKYGQGVDNMFVRGKSDHANSSIIGTRIIF